MEPSSSAIYIDLLVFLFLLYLSGFFSSSEVVFFGANRYILKLKKGRVYSVLNKLLEKKHQLLLSILIGNELVNVVLSSYSTKIFVDYFGSKGAGLAVILSSTLIFVFGEVLPKNIVYPFTTKLAPVYAIPFSLVHFVFWPVRFLLNKLTKRILGDGMEKEASTKDSLMDILEMALNQKVFDHQDIVIAQKVLSLDSVLVKEIMVPKPDMFVLDEDLTVNESIDLILKKKHSRVPLYKENQDNITGILYVKDIVPLDLTRDKKLGELKKQALFVPEVQTLRDLLEELKSENKQMAIVVGEHGEVVGLITLYDILKFCFGTLPESWEGGIVRVSKDMYKIEAWVDVEEFSQELGISLPEEYEYDTVGGFVMSMLGHIPEEGDEFEYDGYKFKVQKMEGNRILYVYAIKVGKEALK